MKNRAIRRHQVRRLKVKHKKRLKMRSFDNHEITPKEVGKALAVHGAQCSCPMCGNPRKYTSSVTLQEQKQQIKDNTYEYE